MPLWTAALAGVASVLVVFPILFWPIAHWVEPEWAGRFISFPYRLWRDLILGVMGREPLG